MTDEQKAAVAALAEMFSDQMFAIQVGPAMRCEEADTVADFLRVFGHGHQAELWLHGHSVGDDEATDSHHDYPEPKEAP